MALAERMSLDEALANVPASVGDAFAAFQAAPTAAAGTGVLAQLQVVYQRAHGEKDFLQMGCEAKQDNATFDVKIARSGLMAVESQATRMQERLRSLQTGIDRSLAEIESLRAQHDEHSRLCGKGRGARKKEAALLAKDAAAAEAFVTQVTGSCNSAGGTAPVLVECSLADGTMVTTFQDAALRQVVAGLSGLSEQLVGLNLERSVRRAETADGAVSLVELTSTRQRLRRTRKKSLQRLDEPAATGDLPADELCNVVQSPSCQSFADSMATFQGNVQDLIVESRRSAGQEGDHCGRSLATYDAQVQDLKRHVDASNVALANAVSEKGAYDARRREKQAVLRDVAQGADEELSQCRDKLRDLDEAMCGAKKLRRELGTTATGSFLGDCEVTEWTAGPCSVTCGGGGTMLLTREVVNRGAPAAAAASSFAQLGRQHRRLQHQQQHRHRHRQSGAQKTDPVTTTTTTTTKVLHINAAGGAAVVLHHLGVNGAEDQQCPVLEITKACNPQLCPIDAIMGRWGQWSECSRACGGGLKLRRRRVHREAQHGGIPVGETVQEQLCNIQPCDQDCALADWAPWAGCSKVCGTGHRARVRSVIRPVFGEGSCPGEHDGQRIQTKSCNQHACTEGAALKKCGAMLDIALVLDASGSGGQAGFASAKAFATKLVNRVTLNEETGVQLGVVSFGSLATVEQALSLESATILQTLTASTWQGSNTNTAGALDQAHEMLKNSGGLSRDGAKPVIVLVTDGMPTRALLADTMVSRLKEEGVRVVFVAVGSGLSRAALEKWASWPFRENIVTAPSYAKLDEEKVTELLADICPVFA